MARQRGFWRDNHVRYAFAVNTLRLPNSPRMLRISEGALLFLQRVVKSADLVKQEAGDIRQNAASFSVSSSLPSSTALIFHVGSCEPLPGCSPFPA